MKHTLPAFFMLLALAAPAAAQHEHGLDQRGKRFMGFDQQTTAHHFILLQDGGRIEVTAKDPGDTAAITQIRDHLRHIATVFATGDFNLPALVHDTKAVPGVDAMKANARSLTFTFEPIDRGGHVRITGATPQAIAAVHEFLRFQITDHKTGDPLVVK
jgi:hypothetical protein